MNHMQEVWHPGIFIKILKDQKVIFTGTGADELFGNYGKWKKLYF